MISYWEQESFIEYDNIIIGSGIVGLSVAIELKERWPGQRVLVLERGLLPTGASTRNAGFACMGSVTELLDDLQNASEDMVVQLFERRKNGLDILKRRLGEEAIGYAENGSFELISKNEYDAVGNIEYLNNILMPITGKPAFRLTNENIEQFGFSGDYTKALIENTCEGELHSGKMMRALTDVALSYGIEIKTGADVSRFDDNGNNVSVIVQDPFRSEEYLLKCNKLVICTNAFTPQLLPGIDVVPGRGQVLITKPIKGLKFRGIYHFDKGYYYFREINGRVLLGGGRNLDFATETSIDFVMNPHIQADLEQKLRNIILPSTPFEIDQRWTGIMAFGQTKSPIVTAISERVFGAFRMGGMGVALGSEVARQVVGMMN